MTETKTADARTAGAVAACRKRWKTIRGVHVRADDRGAVYARVWPGHPYQRRPGWLAQVEGRPESRQRFQHLDDAKQAMEDATR